MNNLDRMDESVKEEAEGVHNTLYVISLSQMNVLMNPYHYVTLFYRVRVISNPVQLFLC